MVIYQSKHPNLVFKLFSATVNVVFREGLNTITSLGGELND